MQGSAYWTYDDEVKAWYFGLNERSPPPYRKHIKVEAVLDLDSDGRVAGVENFDWSPNGAPVEPPIHRRGTMPKRHKGERLAGRRRSAPEPRVKLGSLLAEIGREFGGVEVDIGRDSTETEPPIFE